MPGKSQLQRQVDAGFLRACEKWGWPKPRKYFTRNIAADLETAIKVEEGAE